MKIDSNLIDANVLELRDSGNQKVGFLAQIEIEVIDTRRKKGWQYYPGNGYFNVCSRNYVRKSFDFCMQLECQQLCCRIF